MARPKSTDGSGSARERIEEAFWELLAEGGYENVTIKALKSRAGVNHNLIYYYYEGIDDVARRAFEGNIATELPAMVMSASSRDAVIEPAILSTEDMRLRFSRVRLFASSGSAYLQGLLKDGLMTEWLAQAGKGPDDLDVLERLQLDFVLSAIVALLGNEEAYADPDLVGEFFGTDLGMSVARTLKGILG